MVKMGSLAAVVAVSMGTDEFAQMVQDVCNACVIIRIGGQLRYLENEEQRTGEL